MKQRSEQTNFRPVLSRSLSFLLTLLFSALSTPVLAGSITGKVTVPGLRDNSNVLVYIATAPGQFPPQAPVQLDQRSLMFQPHVLPIVVGTTVNFLNGDDVQHNIFTPSATGDFFNLGTFPKGQSRSYTFTKMGKVDLLCNVHHEMKAYILVLQNPFFALTDNAGNFRIDNVPPGSYQLKVWHERASATPKSIQVAGSAVTTSFDLVTK